MGQLLRDVDRRLNRIIRRHSRIMKCEKRNSKLERFEETVDGVMDWIYDAEVFGSCNVEGTYDAVTERTDKLEVRRQFPKEVNLESFGKMLGKNKQPLKPLVAHSISW
mgnify:FL=1